MSDELNIYKWTVNQRDDMALVWKWLVVVHYPVSIHEERGDIVSKHRTYEEATKHGKSGRFCIRCTQYVDALEDD